MKTSTYKFHPILSLAFFSILAVSIIFNVLSRGSLDLSDQLFIVFALPLGTMLATYRIKTSEAGIELSVFWCSRKIAWENITDVKSWSFGFRRYFRVMAGKKALAISASTVSLPELFRDILNHIKPQAVVDPYVLAISRMPKASFSITRLVKMLLIGAVIAIILFALIAFTERFTMAAAIGPAIL